MSQTCHKWAVEVWEAYRGRLGWYIRSRHKTRVAAELASNKIRGSRVVFIKEL